MYVSCNETYVTEMYATLALRDSLHIDFSNKKDFCLEYPFVFLYVGPITFNKAKQFCFASVSLLQNLRQHLSETTYFYMKEFSHTSRVVVVLIFLYRASKSPEPFTRTRNCRNTQPVKHISLPP